MFPGFREYLLLARKSAYWSNWEGVNDGEATSTRDNPNRLRAFLSETSIGLAWYIRLRRNILYHQDIESDEMDDQGPKINYPEDK